MKRLGRFLTRTAMVLMAGPALCLLGGCSTHMASSVLESNLLYGGALLAAAGAPGAEIEQIYYLGVLDPQEQVPSTVYRVRVHGQASAISFTSFASGWVRASLIDSLGSSIGADKETGDISITNTADADFGSLKTGRRLVLFGPEGFREAPKDHRLVIVMGASPEKFFKAMDESLGIVAEVKAEQRATSLQTELFQALIQVKGERERLDDLMRDIESDLPEEETQPSA